MLPRQRISCFRDLVTWSANLDHVSPYLHPHIHTQHVRILRSPFLLLSSRPACQVGLMLAALGVCEIRAIVLVDGKTKAAFEGADVVFEKIWILVKVDGFKSEFS